MLMKNVCFSGKGICNMSTSGKRLLNEDIRTTKFKPDPEV